VTSLLGIIAGIYGALVGFYVILFGDLIIEPRGLVQGLFKNRMKKNLLPYISGTKDVEGYDEIRTQEGEDFEKLLLQQRVEDLEKFKSYLEDFVVGTSLLDFIKGELLSASKE
ncbi:14781_t:CDS:2, partial [Dentiscutata heterogama]